MSKFRISMKLQGFELDIEGTREDMPVITRNLSQQFAGMLQPSGAIIEGQVVRGAQDVHAQIASAEVQPRKKSRRKNGAPAGNGGAEAEETAVDWRHDPAKYGNPKQTWKTAQKAMWLLHVVAAETDVKDLSGSRLVQTFNKHFRTAGAITTSNVNRDLGMMKARITPSPVAEDTTQNPARWYLTEVGQGKASDLVAEALGRTTTH